MVLTLLVGTDNSNPTRTAGSEKSIISTNKFSKAINYIINKIYVSSEHYTTSLCSPSKRWKHHRFSRRQAREWNFLRFLVLQQLLYPSQARRIHQASANCRNGPQWGSLPKDEHYSGRIAYSDDLYSGIPGPDPGEETYDPIAQLSHTHQALPELQLFDPLFCMPSAVDNFSSPVAAYFDTDSSPVGIDNRCSVCMSNVKEDFVGPLIKTQRAVRGYEGVKVHVMYQGTVKWTIEDNDGVKHDILIPGSFYVPDSHHRLISPQHWAQQAYAASTSSKRDPDGTFCTTFHNRAELVWGNNRFRRTIPVDAQNVFTFDLASGLISSQRSAVRSAMTVTIRTSLQTPCPTTSVPCRCLQILLQREKIHKGNESRWKR